MLNNQENCLLIIVCLLMNHQQTDDIYNFAVILYCSGNNGGRNGITVYRDANFRGQSESFRGEQYDLGRSGFNDAISSIEVNGAWEVCTDANFRGQGQIIDGSVRNLDRWGLNDRISSMRPARSGGRR